jgi:hypothetical protein
LDGYHLYHHHYHYHYHLGLDLMEEQLKEHHQKTDEDH